MTIKSADGLTFVQFIKKANEDLSNVRYVCTFGDMLSNFADLNVFIFAVVDNPEMLKDYKIVELL